MKDFKLTYRQVQSLINNERQRWHCTLCGKWLTDDYDVGTLKLIQTHDALVHNNKDN